MDVIQQGRGLKSDYKLTHADIKEFGFVYLYQFIRKYVYKWQIRNVDGESSGGLMRIIVCA